MQWELVATWAGLLITAGTGIYKMGKQAQTIENQGDRIDSLENQLAKTQELPIKLATVETDIKYLIREISDIKQFLMRKQGE